MSALSPVDALATAQSTIASRMLGADAATPQLGEIELRPHQREAVLRARVALERFGGVLLADEVGWGKTYIALSAAQPCERLLVVAPAALRDAWNDALMRAAVSGQVVSVESLARRSYAGAAPDAVIVDESHRLRNQHTRRYAAVASLCRSSRVLLLSATPVQNRRADLEAQLALFLGARAATLSPAQLAQIVVRRVATSGLDTMPVLRGPFWVRLEQDDDWLDELLALPAAVPPADGGDGGALLAFSLARRWASSRGALVASLRRRQATAVAIENALEAGRRPTRRELGAWCAVEDSVQLAFPELGASECATPTATLLAAVRSQAEAVSSLLARVQSTPDPDVRRAECLREIRGRHPDEIVLAFSEYADTVSALARQLAFDGGVAWLAGHGARMASGVVSRREVLAQLTPAGATPPAAARIGLLLATDVLSEGLNLQRASVVVHLDLPWNPARLQQRVGRARRIGSAHAAVTVYALAPPAGAERLLEIDRRLRDKLRIASRTVGVAGGILPPLWSPEAIVVAAGDPAGGPEARSELLATLRRWAGEARIDTRHSTPLPLVAAAAAKQSGYLALVVERGAPLLVARMEGVLTEDPVMVCRALGSLCGAARVAAPRVAAHAITEVQHWMDARRATADVDLAASIAEPARRRALRRIDAIAGRARRHESARVAVLASHARAVAVAPLPIGSERVLTTLVDAQVDDLAWLRALAAFGETHVRLPSPVESEGQARLEVLILLDFSEPTTGAAT